MITSEEAYLGISISIMNKQNRDAVYLNNEMRQPVYH